MPGSTLLDHGEAEVHHIALGAADIGPPDTAVILVRVERDLHGRAVRAVVEGGVWTSWMSYILFNLSESVGDGAMRMNIVPTA